VTMGLKPPPERKLPISEMSAAQLSSYRQALVRYLKRCRKEEPCHWETRTCLADVMAEEQTRKLRDRASRMTLMVPRVHL
jgi:hypothetical protein